MNNTYLICEVGTTSGVLIRDVSSVQRCPLRWVPLYLWVYLWLSCGCWPLTPFIGQLEQLHKHLHTVTQPCLHWDFLASSTFHFLSELWGETVKWSWPYNPGFDHHLQFVTGGVESDFSAVLRSLDLCWYYHWKRLPQGVLVLLKMVLTNANSEHRSRRCHCLTWLQVDQIYEGACTPLVA